MTWFKTELGNYIKIEEIICINEAERFDFDKVLYFNNRLCQYISKNDFIKLKKLLKLK